MTNLTQLDQLYAAATPGPWEQACGRTCEAVVATNRKHDSVEQVRYDGSPVAITDTDPNCGSSESENEANAACITALHNAYPALRDEIVQLRQRVAELEAGGGKQ